MKSLLLAVLLVFSVGCSAQEDVYDADMFAALDDAQFCTYKIQEAQLYVTTAVKASDEREYDYAFHYIREGYIEVLTATNVCEGEQLATAETYYEEWKLIRSLIACSYHSYNATLHLEDARTIIEDNEQDWSGAAFPARRALYFLSHGLDWCGPDEKQLETVEGFYVNTIDLIATIEQTFGNKE